jgi:hypothetical protein
MEKVQKIRHPYVLPIIILVVFSVWWLVIRFGSPSNNTLEWFSGTYGVMAIVGAYLGFRISSLWGGRKSLIGRAIQFFAISLLAQEFGQITYSLYTLAFHKEIPYPSIGDIGYFGSVLLYIYGSILLARAVVVKFSAKEYVRRSVAIIIPIIILAASYFEFLKGYQFDWSQPLTIFLDFGYPLGQAVYVSIALLVFLLSRKYLGGVMRPVILTILLALAVQYTADFMFLFQTNRGTWTTAGVNDYIYLISYFVMTVALIRFSTVFKKMLSIPSDVNAAADQGEA